jgi:hypothetical protein
MKRTWIPVLLICAAPALAWGAPAAAANGVYLVDFHVRLGTVVPDGSLVTCKVRIMPGVPAPGRAQLPAAQTVTGVATVQGASAHCAVQIPAAWTDARTTATLSYEIDAAEPAGARMLVRMASGDGVSLPQPPAGGAARLDLSLSL